MYNSIYSLHSVGRFYVFSSSLSISIGNKQLTAKHFAVYILYICINFCL